VDLDHIFCLVNPDDDGAARLEGAGWQLDAGSVHAGQGTRNRRLRWSGCYMELLWVHDVVEARHNALRLDRRAEWERTGASPFGIGVRGTLSEAERVDYWLYDGLEMPVWVHRDNEEAQERPFVFALDVGGGPPSPAPVNPGALQVVRHSGPSSARLPPLRGTHRLDLVLDGGLPVVVAPELRLSRE
jgi:Glyoxalase-like domain